MSFRLFGWKLLFEGGTMKVEKKSPPPQPPPPAEIILTMSSDEALNLLNLLGRYIDQNPSIPSGHVARVAYRALFNIDYTSI